MISYVQFSNHTSYEVSSLNFVKVLLQFCQPAKYYDPCVNKRDHKHYTIFTGLVQKPRAWNSPTATNFLYLIDSNGLTKCISKASYADVYSNNGTSFFRYLPTLWSSTSSGWLFRFLHLTQVFIHLLPRVERRTLAEFDAKITTPYNLWTSFTRQV